ncbi:hypothetical protein AQJ64_20325 [Streptomyces griseoruber]|uniref:Uncharacterized protein n=1 Tax=Streptomyces griseoruber TaxID=1943 RepID=A0A117RBR9_9ACTN|nr:hypothetical protein AQJ64_20325 [Streptomyces griseoruber]
MVPSAWNGASSTVTPQASTNGRLFGSGQAGVPKWSVTVSRISSVAPGAPSWIRVAASARARAARSSSE